MTFVRFVTSLIVLTFFTGLAPFDSLPNTLADDKFTAEQLEFFEKEVRPILVESCQECHGAEEQEASLRLDSRTSILKGGDSGPAVVPNDLEQSELWGAVLYDPLGYQMPPDGKLTDEKLASLKKWILMGAPWPDEGESGPAVANEFNLEERAKHWSFQALAKVKPPQVQKQTWTRNGIDNFILEKLEDNKLKPATETDSNTWIRRAYIDAIGLPPSPEQVEAFVNDDSDNAHQKVIDDLLKSPHFGERWGRHWLDLMRYAESRGHEFDYDVANPWHYRDYVIRALNDDLPFDQFVVEHVCGDILQDKEQATNPRYAKRLNSQTGGNESILATGFWFLGEWVHSPVDIRQEEAERFDNMIDVYSKSFLGLTVACARCHDHKFDPIPQTDYYALQGYLQSTSYQQARFETMEHNRKIAKELEQLDQAYRSEAADILMEGSQTVRNRLDAYWSNALDLIKAGVRPVSTEAIVFADFESGTYEGWTSTGDAFGEIPQTQNTIGSYQGDVKAQGTYFVNSHQHRTGQGDAATGTLTSTPFKISHSHITMLIGGGSHSGKTCANLKIDDAVVLSATGKNKNEMSRVIWDVSKYVGKNAVIEIVDQEEGGWGNIAVDHILFESPQAPTRLLDADQVRIETVAREQQLDLRVLSKTVRFFSDDSQADPFQTLTSIVHPALSDGHFDDGFYRTFENVESHFGNDALLAHGVGFEKSNRFISWGQDWQHLIDAPRVIQEAGKIANWQRAGRVLRTPTFDVQSGKIFALVRGAVNTYVSVDSHITLNGPLHNALVKSHKANDQWHWIEHDVSAYQGHNAYVEFIPQPQRTFSVCTVIQNPTLTKAQRKQGIAFVNKNTTRSLEFIQAFMRMDKVVAGGAIEFSELFLPEDSPASHALEQLTSQHKQNRQELLAKIRKTSHSAPVMAEANGVDEHLFIRGKWQKNGGTVPRRFLKVFNGKVGADSLEQENLAPGEAEMPTEVRSTPSGRYELALAMVDPQQTPILPRVIVNRIWQHYFGRGIVPTPDDFGHLGEAPSHPELLDYLAIELVENNWSLKHIHKLILSSAAYRMKSELDVEQADRIAEVDPDNKLLHRMSVKRMEGEAIRDSILSVSGRLNEKIGGPSVPVFLTSFMQGRGRPGKSGPVDGEGRRSLYLSVRRNFPEPFLQAFDFPTPHSCIGRRNVSNVPAQALGLMNNPMVIEQSSVWAKTMLSEMTKQSVSQRIQYLFGAAFSREPTDSEIALGEAFITSRASEAMTSTDDVNIWSDYCHVLFNMKEFIFVR